MGIDRTRNRLTATVDSSGKVINRWKRIEETTSAAQVVAIPSMRSVSAGTSFANRPDCPDGWVDLFHRTSTQSADAIYDSASMLTKETGGTAFFSTFDGTETDAQGDGYGDSVVWIRVPEDDIMLDDEFPSGELHYQVPLELISKDALMGREGFHGPQVQDTPAGTVPAKLHSLVQDITEYATHVEFMHHGDEDALKRFPELSDDTITLNYCSYGDVADNNCYVVSSVLLERELDDLPSGMKPEMIGVSHLNGNHFAIGITDQSGNEWVLDYTMRQFNQDLPFPFLGSRAQWNALMASECGPIEEYDHQEF